MDRLLKTSGTKAKLIVASKELTAVTFTEDGKTVADPHAFQSIPNVMRYVQNIRDGLSEADKGNTEFYRDNADAYLAKLRTLDAWVRAKLGSVPAAERKIITNHDAFGYFAKAYDVKILAAQGVQTGGEPSAKRIAQLAKQIKDEGVKAVFIENISDPRLMQKLEKQSGAKFGGKLYSDALSATPPANTYEGLMRWNVTAITDALR
jgi:zinc/manganese transport system substrate-binding protein